MSETTTHVRGDAQTFNPITGESPGIAEILERRTRQETDGTALAADAQPPEDDAAKVAAELKTWRTRATEAEALAAEQTRARQAAEQAAHQSRQGAEDTGFAAITSALDARAREREGLQAEMKAAGEAGDFGRVADVSVRLGEIGAELRDLERGKREFEQARDARLRAPPPQTQAAPIAASAEERSILGRLGVQTRDAFLATRTPATAAFLRETPDFFTSESAFQRISGADSIAKGRGIPVDSAAYFDLIRQEAGLTQPTTRQREAPPGTPPSRDAPPPTGRAPQRGGDVYVTADQRRAAEWIGMDPVEYAQEDARLRASGAIPYRRR